MREMAVREVYEGTGACARFVSELEDVSFIASKAGDRPVLIDGGAGARR
jgi:hypothetical protein